MVLVSQFPYVVTQLSNCLLGWVVKIASMVVKPGFELIFCTAYVSFCGACICVCYGCLVNCALNKAVTGKRAVCLNTAVTGSGARGVVA